MPKPKPDEVADADDVEQDLATRPAEPSRQTRTTDQRRTPMVIPTTSARTRTRLFRIVPKRSHGWRWKNVRL